MHENFGSNIAWSAAGSLHDHLACKIVGKDLGEAKISYLDLCIFGRIFEEYILWFEIAMRDTLRSK